jgi:Protein of unknown function (DUF3987)
MSRAAPDDDTIAIRVPRPIHWPAGPVPSAFHGLAGDIARATAPHTEADPIAVLVQLLVAYGAVIGRGAHRRVGVSEHHANEFVVLVGPSAKARKGTSWDLVEALIAAVDPGFVDHNIHSGMSSGEGLIDKVRDPVHETSHHGQQILKAAGIDDKRMLVLESEFALVLRVLAREGNTLSAVVRNCWDGRTLQTMTKNTPARATRPHISIIGHITADEMLRYLTTTELASGFINRFVLVAVRRTQLLPDGGDLAAMDWPSLTNRLAAAVDHGHNAKELTVTPAARDQWRKIYPQVSVDSPGIFGAATARAEAHVVRFALLYALLDCSQDIDTVHLDAAHALWDYASRSTHWLFGDTLGDPVADDIWQAIMANTDGLTKSEIRDLFSPNKSVKAINAGIDALVRAGRLERTIRSCGQRGGRPAELFVPNTPSPTAPAKAPQTA